MVLWRMSISDGGVTFVRWCIWNPWRTSALLGWCHALQGRGVLLANSRARRGRFPTRRMRLMPYIYSYTKYQLSFVLKTRTLDRMDSAGVPTQQGRVSLSSLMGHVRQESPSRLSSRQPLWDWLWYPSALSRWSMAYCGDVYRYIHIGIHWPRGPFWLYTGSWLHCRWPSLPKHLYTQI